MGFGFHELIALGSDQGCVVYGWCNLFSLADFDRQFLGSISNIARLR